MYLKDIPQLHVYDWFIITSVVFMLTLVVAIVNNPPQQMIWYVLTTCIYMYLHVEQPSTEAARSK